MNLGPIKDKTIQGRKSFRKILGKQGAYALVIGCVGIIAITAALSLGSPVKNPSDLPNNEAALPAKTAGMNPAPSYQADLPVPTAGNDSAVSGNTKVEDATVSMLMPVSSTSMERGYAEDTLVFSNTLKQWSTHLGVDITAAEGSEVFCALDGTVASITQDTLMGNEVVVTHSDGLKTVYAALKTVNTDLAVGSKVQRGQVIATVGNTAVTEIEDGAHLHFEVLKNDVDVSPENYLSGLTK